MMIIWGRPINIELIDVLEDLKEESIKKTKIEHLERIQIVKNDIFITCPNYEAHGGSERTPSCSVHKEYGMVHCFGCGYSTSLPGLIAKLLNLPDITSGYRWLLKKYFVPERGERPLIPLKDKRPQPRIYLPELVLDKYQYDHPYMFSRGLTADTIDLFDLGFDKTSNSITIPIRDVNGKIVYIKKRRIQKTKFHKYHVDEGVEKTDLIFGLHLIKKNIQNVKMIYLVEGEFDVISCYQAKKYGGGIQGDRLFDSQVKQLIKIAKGIPICLLYDNNKAGVECMKKSIVKLSNYFPLYRPYYPSGSKDPNELLIKGQLEDLPIRPISPF